MVADGEREEGSGLAGTLGRLGGLGPGEGFFFYFNCFVVFLFTVIVLF